MPRSKDQQEKVSPSLPNRKETSPYRTLPLDFAQITQSNFWELCDKRIINAKTAVYLYTIMKSNLQTGISHRIYYDDVERDTGFSVRQIFRAAQELESAGFIERAHSGYYQAYTPAIKAASEIKEHREKFKSEKRFWEELNKRIREHFKKNQYNRDNLPPITIINALYSQLVSKRQNRRTHNYVPPEEGTAHILPNLRAHTPPDSPFQEIYRLYEEMSY